jgi:hypothetical protein
MDMPEKKIKYCFNLPLNRGGWRRSTEEFDTWEEAAEWVEERWGEDGLVLIKEIESVIHPLPPKASILWDLERWREEEAAGRKWNVEHQAEKEAQQV